jgi:hypothetical protein
MIAAVTDGPSPEDLKRVEERLILLLDRAFRQAEAGGEDPKSA